VNRREFLFASAAAATPAGLVAAGAQFERPVRLMVGFPPGGAADTLARSLAELLRIGLGTAVVVENKPGAGGRIAAEHIKGAPADGTTLLVTPSSVITLSPHLYRNRRFDLEENFTPIAPLARLELALYAGRAMPDGVATPSGVVEWLIGHPESRVCGIPGLGSTPHLVALLLGRQALLDWRVLPYQGDAPTYLALLSGEIPVAVSSLAGGMEHLRSRKFRLMAVAGSRRSVFFPDVPTLSQAGYPGVIVEDQLGVFAPKHTPQAVVETLNQSLRVALNSNDGREALRRLSLESAFDDAERFARVLKSDSARWAAVVKELNLSMD
jgi:tripartite-type tricarboxylate transporter receptor subunit TctC